MSYYFTHIFMPKEHDARALGRRLREGRERLSMTQAALGEGSGIGISSLSEFETGKREPTLSQLKRLAIALRTDVAGLLSPARSASDVVRWRQRPDEAAPIEAHFLRLCRQYRDLEHWAGEETPMKFRGTDKLPLTWSAAASFAREIRGEMRLGDRPGLVLRRRLEDDYALKTFNLRVEPSGTAACTVSPEYGFAVLLNSLNSPARRAFDLAHELFHLLTWNVPSEESTREHEERLADCFAAALLLPEDALRSATDRRIRNGRISSANLCELARDFGVSIDALIWRMHNVYGWQDAERTKQLIEDARTLTGPYRDLTPDTEDEAQELPERYRALALHALRSGEISTGRFAEYMGISRWQAMKYSDEAAGGDTLSLPVA